MAIKLVLSRKNEWLNRLRPYKVLVDGQQVGKIGNGKVEEFELPSISHSLECKVDWCYSNKYELTVPDGGTIYLQVKSGLKAFWIIYPVLIITLLSSFLFKNLNGYADYQDWILTIGYGIPGLYFAYYLTIGRRHYLKLEKDNNNVFAA